MIETQTTQIKDTQTQNTQTKRQLPNASLDTSFGGMQLPKLQRGLSEQISTRHLSALVATALCALRLSSVSVEAQGSEPYLRAYGAGIGTQLISRPQDDPECPVIETLEARSMHGVDEVYSVNGNYRQIAHATGSTSPGANFRSHIACISGIISVHGEALPYQYKSICAFDDYLGYGEANAVLSDRVTVNGPFGTSTIAATLQGRFLGTFYPGIAEWIILGIRGRAGDAPVSISMSASIARETPPHYGGEMSINRSASTPVHSFPDRHDIDEKFELQVLLNADNRTFKVGSVVSFTGVAGAFADLRAEFKLVLPPGFSHLGTLGFCHEEPKQLLEIAIEAGKFIVTWPWQGAEYVLQWADSPNSATWHDLNLVPTEIQGKQAIEVPPSTEGARFFRLKKNIPTP